MKKQRIKAPMSLVGLVLVGVLAGCNSPEQQKLIGIWQIADSNSVAKRVGNEHLETDSNASKMTIEFRANGTMVTQTQLGSIDSTKEGTWQVLHFDPATNEMTIASVLQQQPIESQIEFLEDDIIRWVPPNMAGTTRKMKFQRIK